MTSAEHLVGGTVFSAFAATASWCLTGSLGGSIGVFSLGMCAVVLSMLACRADGCFKDEDES